MRRARIPHTCVRQYASLQPALGRAAACVCARSAGRRSPSSSPSPRCPPAPRTRARPDGGPRRAKSSFPKKPAACSGRTPKIDQAQPLYLQADQLLYDTKSNRVIAQGNVEIYYNNYILTADQVVYDQGTNKLIAEGNAQLKDPNGSITRADRFEALDDFRDAFIQSLSVVTADDTRIAAERANRREGNTTEYERAKFTPCKNDPGMPPLWCISAARIIHDQRAATITYQDAQFELFGVPVVYVPYFEHPDPSVKHRSGFLMPSYTNSSTLGFGFEVPYYFALAPNFDFTFHPKYWSNYGRAVAGRVAPSPVQRPVHGFRSPPSTRARRHGVGQWRRPTAGAGRSRPRANSRSRPGGGSDGTSRSTATTASAASTSSIRSCRPTASTPSICRA